MNKKLEKYFSLSDTTYLIGGALLVAAFFFIWLGWSYSYYMFIVGIAVFAVGLAMFILGSIGRIGAEDIDQARDIRLENFGREQLEDIHLAKRIASHVEQTYIVQYDYEGEGLESRHSRDGAWRTSIVSAFRIFYLHDALLILRHSFSILNDYEEITPATEYKYSELGKAQIVRDQVKLKSGKASYTVNHAVLVITDKNENVILRSQVSDDIDADHLADRINRIIEHGNAQ
ncbi:MAG: hypothetical protein IJY27_00810 [Clostridia bacterium]|nr:hypothetical protein [Clostridia bacterium]